MLISDHIMRARNNATSTASAKPRRDYLIVEFFPLEAPTILFFTWGFRNGHSREDTSIYADACALEENSGRAPSAGFEPAHMAPEANALSPELRGHLSTCSVLAEREAPNRLPISRLILVVLLLG